MFKKLQRKAPKLPLEGKKELLLFQDKLNYSFSDFELLSNALTHSSFANECKDQISDNERLEFLGDSLLSIVVSEYLYNNIDGNEGVYTRLRSSVVSEQSLAKIARKISVNEFIKIGKGEEQTGGRNKDAILADCIEAIFAAVYLDSDFNTIRKFILKLIVPEIELSLNNLNTKDYKTLLQEFVQKKYKIVPEYKLEKTEGPEHNQIFYYSVSFKGKTFGPAKGHNKKDAEQNAAKSAWTELGFEKSL